MMYRQMNFLLFNIVDRGTSYSAFASASASAVDCLLPSRFIFSSIVDCSSGLWYLVIVQRPKAHKAIQHKLSDRIIVGTLTATSSRKSISLPLLVGCKTGLTSVGLHKCLEIIPKKKPPNPNPQITNPETTPFLPGK